MSINTKVRTRFAPSPTGSMHIGNLRTALYAYALSRNRGGQFILRIEDTDKKREKVGGVTEIVDLLTIFGIKWDEYYVQSERVKEGIYRRAAERLVGEGRAFYCQCDAKNAKEEGFSDELRDPCRDKGFDEGAIKLKVPDNEIVSFKDYVLGKEVQWNSSTIGDATLLKTDAYPTYHLAVVVDDSDMHISHVLRGHDWMPSTPIHLLVYKYLEFIPPAIGHLTDILDPEGGKLSKRKGSTSCEGLLNEGYLPQAILNFIMLTGWAPKDNNEIFSLEEFVKEFNPNGFQKANPTFNRDKLDWFNQHYIQALSDKDLTQKLIDFAPKDVDLKLLEKITPLVKTRMKKLSEFNSLAGFFFEQPKIDKKLFGENYKSHLLSSIKILESIVEWKLENINNGLMIMIEKENFKTGNLFMDLRIAITGSKYTPPINESLEILGKEETVNRLSNIVGNRK